MTRTEFAEQLARRTGIPKSRARKVVAELFDGADGIIADALKRGEKLILPGFGTFSVVQRAPRVGRNPRTGRKVKIEACRAATFKAGKTLKSVLRSRPELLGGERKKG